MDKYLDSSKAGIAITKVAKAMQSLTTYEEWINYFKSVNAEYLTRGNVTIPAGTTIVHLFLDTMVLAARDSQSDMQRYMLSYDKRINAVAAANAIKANL